jgi:antirestriction protein ArdC
MKIGSATSCEKIATTANAVHIGELKKGFYCTSSDVVEWPEFGTDL